MNVSPQTPKSAREQFGTRAGFVLAAVGSAVGLGNMWRFPYQTAEGGSAAFLVAYVCMAFLVGVPMMLAEFAVGRGTRQSAVGALRSVGGRRWAAAGLLFLVTSTVIMACLSVSLPSAFAQMEALGRIVGTLFFLAVIVAAITSAVSRLQVAAALLIDELGWTRRRAALASGSLIAVIGIAPALSLGALGIMDQVAAELLTVLGVLVIAVLVGWVMKHPEEEFRIGASPRVVRLIPAARFLIRYGAASARVRGLDRTPADDPRGGRRLIGPRGTLGATRVGRRSPQGGTRAYRPRADGAGGSSTAGVRQHGGAEARHAAPDAGLPAGEDRDRARPRRGARTRILAPAR